ncbi:cytochrome p450 [Aureococcus anophagefferens]|nr:cytochrome p450 [Aureococcus anophagefferens]
MATEVSFGSNVVGEHMLYNIPMSKAFPRVRRLAASCAAVRRQVFMPLIERRRAMVRAGAAPDDCLTALVASDGDEAFSDDDLLDQPHVHRSRAALLEMRVFFGRLLDRPSSGRPGFAPTIKAGVSLTVENPKGIKVRFRKRV